MNVFGRIAVWEGNITTLEVDAVVNAANESLLGGGGVDGAIHRAAGPELLEACRALGPCPTGEARITPAFNLKARFVIHTVGPRWQGGKDGESELLSNCYRKSLELAMAEGVDTIAFPSISTGAYGYPIEEATEVAMETVAEWLTEHDMPRRVIMCTFDARATRLMRQARMDLADDRED